MTKPEQRKVAALLWAALSVLAGVAAITLGVLWWVSAPPPDSPRDLAGTPIRAALPSLDDVAAGPAGERFRAPRQGLDVSLRSAQLDRHGLTPPTLTDAFWYRDFGDPSDPTSGTVIVAMHSVRGGAGPGNAFADRSSQDSATVIRVASGDQLHLGDATYVVTKVEARTKSATAEDPRLWSGTGPDLVVVTCLIDPRVPLDDQENLLVFADRA